MQIWQAVLLGLTQGLTEFLPVSSSGHLVFLQNLMGITNSGIDTMFFNIILHVATLIAVCVVFWRDIIELFKKPYKTLLYLIVATIPAAVVGVVLELFGDAINGSPYIGIILAVCFTCTAVLLLVTELYAKRRAKEKELPLCWRTTVSMGCAQAVAAIFPGLSRSGSTICAGLLAGGRSEDLSKFSFVMSIPIILGSFFVSLVLGLFDGGIATSFQSMGSVSNAVWCVVLGFICAALSGLFAIKVMLAAIKKVNYKWFSLYLVLLAITCIVLFCCGKI